MTLVGSFFDSHNSLLITLHFTNYWISVVLSSVPSYFIFVVLLGWQVGRVVDGVFGIFWIVHCPVIVLSCKSFFPDSTYDYRPKGAHLGRLVQTLSKTCNLR